MGVTYSKGSEFPERAIGAATLADLLIGFVGTDNFKIAIATLQYLILNSSGGTTRGIGTNVLDAIVTTNDSQDLSSKNLDNTCKILSGNPLTVNSTELNHCKSLSQNAESRFGTDESAITALQGSVSTLSGSVAEVQSQVSAHKKYTAKITATAGGTLSINDTTIEATDAIEWDSLMISVYEATNDGLMTLASPTIEVYSKVVETDRVLLRIDFSGLTGGEEHYFVIYYSLYNS
jgi:hypothetical protein